MLEISRSARQGEKYTASMTRKPRSHVMTAPFCLHVFLQVLLLDTLLALRPRSSRTLLIETAGKSEMRSP